MGKTEILQDKGRSPKIWGFGSAALDFRIRTAELGSDYRDKLNALETEILGGGAVANCMVQIARLGGNSAWLGKLGCDWIGDEIISGLKREHVDCSYVIREAGVCSPFNLAAYSGADRRRIGGFLLPNSLANLTEDDLEQLVREITPGDIVMIEIGEISAAACRSFAGRAAGKGARIAVDIDLDPVAQSEADINDVYAVIEAAAFVMPNANALSNMFPNRSPSNLADICTQTWQGVTILSAGAEGIYFRSESGTIVHRKPVTADIIDTVGAGDAFHGGFLHGIASGKSIDSSVDLGMKCAAANCGKRGARTGMPNLDEISD
jgi:sugar/nucleoside kinase (ribokinase family)